MVKFYTSELEANKIAMALHAKYPEKHFFTKHMFSLRAWAIEVYTKEGGFVETICTGSLYDDQEITTNNNGSK